MEKPVYGDKKHRHAWSSRLFGFDGPIAKDPQKEISNDSYPQGQDESKDKAPDDVLDQIFFDPDQSEFVGILNAIGDAQYPSSCNIREIQDKRENRRDTDVGGNDGDKFIKL